MNRAGKSPLAPPQNVHRLEVCPREGIAVILILNTIVMNEYIFNKNMEYIADPFAKRMKLLSRLYAAGWAPTISGTGFKVAPLEPYTLNFILCDPKRLSQKL
jgi:hypothetical protein